MAPVAQSVLGYSRKSKAVIQSLTRNGGIVLRLAHLQKTRNSTRQGPPLLRSF